MFPRGNNDANGTYLKRCADAGLKPHPARFPPQLPEFFIKYLTAPDDLVVDIFAGSNTTGMAAEALDWRWLAFELREDCLAADRSRFERPPADAELQDRPVQVASQPSLFTPAAPAPQHFPDAVMTTAAPEFAKRQPFDKCQPPPRGHG